MILLQPVGQVCILLNESFLKIHEDKKTKNLRNNIVRSYLKLICLLKVSTDIGRKLSEIKECDKHSYYTEKSRCVWVGRRVETGNSGSTIYCNNCQINLL